MAELKYIKFNRTLQNEYGKFKAEEVYEFSMANESESEAYEVLSERYETKKMTYFDPVAREPKEGRWIDILSKTEAVKQIKAMKEAKEKESPKTKKKETKKTEV